MTRISIAARGLLRAALCAALALATGESALATPVTGDLFFTVFSGAPNVKKTTFSYDGATTFTLGSPVDIGTTVGADGLAGNPQNSDLLLVGGQGGRINTISKSTGTAVSYASPASVFHVTVTDATTVYGSGIPGALARHTINPDGSLSVGTLIGLSGSNSTITTLISTPTGFFYTAAGSGGFGNFGTLSFTTATTATTTALGFYAAAHGAAFDPYTGSIIMMGDNHITQVDLTGAILADLTFSGMAFDQGTVDGAGHLFAASNTGHMTFVDYAASGLITSGFLSTQFLASNLDDVAPLVGAGSTRPPVTVPEPGVLMLLGLALLGMAAVRRGARQRR